MLAADILDALEEDIVFGVMLPQSRLIEERLAERFDAKRHVIREVFTTLEDLGLVVRVPNKGAVVSELTPVEVSEIYQVRELLEIKAGELTALPADVRITDTMAAVQKKHSAAVADQDYRAVFRLNIEFHRTQYSACPNTHLVQSINDYARKAHLIRAANYGEYGYMQRIVEQHWAIVEAMRSGQKAQLTELIRSHLHGSPEEYVRLYRIRYGHSAAGRAMSST